MARLDLIRRPFEADTLINAIVRTVPGINFASPHVSDSESVDIPCAVWSAFDAEPERSYQNLMGTTHAVSMHVSAGTYVEARELSYDVWAALLNAPTMNLSRVDPKHKILAVNTSDSPVENRTQGQLLNFYEFRFTVYITVGPA